EQDSTPLQRRSSPRRPRPSGAYVARHRPHVPSGQLRQLLETTKPPPRTQGSWEGAFLCFRGFVSELALGDAVLESLPLGLGEAQDRPFALVLGVAYVDAVTLEGDLDTRAVGRRPGRLAPGQPLLFHSSATSRMNAIVCLRDSASARIKSHRSLVLESTSGSLRSRPRTGESA